MRLLGADIGGGVSLGKISCNWPVQLKVGDHTAILDGVVADYCWGIPKPGPSIIIGSNCYIGRSAEFNVRRMVFLGNDCLIAAGVRFVDHDHGTKIGELMRVQVGAEAPIVVGTDVWIGANAIVLKGVKIGDGAVVAAGAVVTKSIPSNEIWGGVPARFLVDANSAFQGNWICFCSSWERCLGQCYVASRDSVSWCLH